MRRQQEQRKLKAISTLSLSRTQALVSHTRASAPAPVKSTKRQTANNVVRLNYVRANKSVCIFCKPFAIINKTIITYEQYLQPCVLCVCNSRYISSLVSLLFHRVCVCMFLYRPLLINRRSKRFACGFVCCFMCGHTHTAKTLLQRAHGRYDILVYDFFNCVCVWPLSPRHAK